MSTPPSSPRTAVARWIRCFRPDPAAARRLFCVPYAGGTAAVFNRWPEALSAAVEVSAFELPGRGTRLQERPLASVEQVVRGMADAVAPRLDRPYALFGHSLGALLAFELARELRSRRARPPLLLVASGRRAPHRPKRSAPVHGLPDARLVEHLRSLKGTPEEVLENPELMELVLPVVRADFEADETYVYREEEPLDVPILALGGTEDSTFPADDLAAWGVHARGRFELTLFEGDHFFIQTERARVLDLLGRRLAT